MYTKRRRIRVITKQWLAMLLALALLPSVGIVGAAAPIDQRLMDAARSGDLKTVNRLLQEGADINAKHQHGRPALLEASERRHVEVVKTLLAKGADINAKNGFGMTALMLASKRGHVDVVKLLKAHGAKE